MSAQDFRTHGHAMVDWIADYLENAEAYPVLSQSQPGDIRASLAEDSIPETGESWDDIWSDFTKKIMPGITHWQSPNFFAYFPANVSYPSILGELLSAGLGVNGMLWATSPAATELETHVLDQLVDAMGLPDHFKGGGVIQDTASNSTLCAILCGREQAMEWQSNESGLSNQPQMAVYTSTQAHSSVEKAAKIAGVGSSFVRLIDCDSTHAMRPEDLRAAIQSDIAIGIQPIAVSATFGTTSSLAIDPLRAVGDICHEFNIWYHVDAAMAGSALICPEFRALADGLESADSFCFNPHKWLLTNFDLDVMYVKEPERLVRTLAILPEYLKTKQVKDDVINYRDWHVPLGRRFRALKLWFVLRTYGLSGLRTFIREHVRLVEMFESWVREDERFELATPRILNLVCFRLIGGDEVNERLLHRINAAGQIYMTHTKLPDGHYTLRFCVAQTNTQEQHVRSAWECILAEATSILDGRY